MPSAGGDGRPCRLENRSARRNRCDLRSYEQPAQKLTIAKIVNGTLSLTRAERKTTVYTIAGAAHEPRTVVIEQPIQKGWKIAGPEEGFDQPFEVTADH